MTDSSDITVRLLAAYENMGTATREDLKEAADTIAALRDKCVVGNSVVAVVVRDLAAASGRPVEEIVSELRWTT